MLVKESLFLVIWRGLDGFRLGVATPSPPAGGRPATRHSSTSEQYSVQLSFVSGRGQLMLAWLLVDTATPLHPPYRWCYVASYQLRSPPCCCRAPCKVAAYGTCVTLADHIFQEENATHGIFRTISNIVVNGGVRSSQLPNKMIFLLYTGTSASIIIFLTSREQRNIVQLCTRS